MAAVLRDLRWPDLPQVEAIEAAVFPDDAWTSASWWAELAARPRREYVVVDDGGQVLGYAGLDHAGATSDIMTIALHPASRRRGLGRILLQECEARAIARGATAMLLEVRADNAAAIGLYAAGGYAVIQTRRRYYQPGDVDALVMRRHLTTNEQEVGA